MLTYKAQLKGIKVIIAEESSTSKSSDLDRDDLPNKYGEEKPLFKGKRLARGLDKMGTNQSLNADVNGHLTSLEK